jgi:hypothetical protein
VPYGPLFFATGLAIIPFWQDCNFSGRGITSDLRRGYTIARRLLKATCEPRERHHTSAARSMQLLEPSLRLLKMATLRQLRLHGGT